MTESQDFSDRILQVLVARFGVDRAHQLIDRSPVVGYLLRKTRAANRGSKSRGSFANLYAIYVLAEDYLAGAFDAGRHYSEYEGAKFTNLMARQRQLPFGAKLQNHALNGRLNDEFRKFYPAVDERPILRNMGTQRYWLNEALFTMEGVNLCAAVIDIIDAYVQARRGTFAAFIDTCQKIELLDDSQRDEKQAFVASLLLPNTDARIFEIASFAIMKAYYGLKTVWLGSTRNSIEEYALELFKTGRTNANDGGIDFVMRPLGRFFQVTETLDLKKYFLDIDKIQKFPITFVIKTELPINEIEMRLRTGAEQAFGTKRIVESYMSAIEELVNIPTLLDYLNSVIHENRFDMLINEIIVQSRVEFNLDDDEEAMIESIDI